MVNYCNFECAVKLIFRQRLQMSENREPRISHLTKPRTRTLISSYRPFLESLTRSALTAYYRAHVVNWPSFLTISCLFPRSPLSSITPGSGSLFQKIKKKSYLFFAQKRRQSTHQLTPADRQSKPKVPIFTQKPSFFSLFCFFRLLFLQLTIHHAVPSIAFSSRAPMKAHWFVLVFTFPFFRLKNGKHTLRLSRIKKNQKHKTVSADQINPTLREHLFDSMLKKCSISTFTKVFLKIEHQMF